MMEKTLHEPVIIFSPSVVTFSAVPNCMKIENMFHKLFWKLTQLHLRKERKYTNE